ncbi:MAG: hypothetical protein JWN66_1086 [Sphingomonas bacterium]|uniref:hypothetical protein n=1 Tax=Sphingomonas bacterium TaxID=1895847 RepID=UPI0026264736|nr:hypothetical protein [Sphingomonas bacterium]MDB5703970.1 hypothetical protein [Sphingomonas bacterium]
MRVVFGMLAGVALSAAAPVHASWLEARTDHFIVDIDADEPNAREYATKLERFDAALRTLYGVADDPARRSNPLRVFALRPALFQRVCGCTSVLGYYDPRAGGSVIFSSYLPDIDQKAPPGSLSPRAVMLHEYSHHFMYSNYPNAYPLWYSEGFAEFNANVQFNADNSMTVGLPANYRYYALHNGNTELPVKELLNPSPDTLRDGFAVDRIYGLGWLLTHYLTLDPARKGQLDTYLALLNKGKPSVEAATMAFGDIRALYHDLFNYLRANKLAPPLRVPAPTHAIAVTITPLSEGAGAMMPVHARSASGVTTKSANDVAKDGERVAARFPADPIVQVDLAEAEFDADDLDAADAAADRALAAAPTNMTALLYKGRVATARAKKAKATDAATWGAARAWFLKANHSDPNAALPLLLYYQSFLAAKAEPSPGALKGLSRAQVLAPEDHTVRFLLARHLLDQGDVASARFLLRPIAYAPHGKADDDRARQAIDLLDAGKVDEAKKAMADKPDKDEK